MIKNIISKSIKKKIKLFLSIFLRRSKLGYLANIYGTDKNSVHKYTDIYTKYFWKLKNKPNVVLEIGIGGSNSNSIGGESLRMWKSFFKNSYIFGIDIFDKKFCDEKRIKTFQGSQDDEVFLNKVIKEIGQPDIIIDDGSHQSDHVIKSFGVLFKELKSGGIYVIEDLQTSYWGLRWGHDWGGSKDINSTKTSMGFLKKLVDSLNWKEFDIEDYKPNYCDLNISSIHFYHNMCFIFKV